MQKHHNPLMDLALCIFKCPCFTLLLLLEAAIFLALLLKIMYLFILNFKSYYQLATIMNAFVMDHCCLKGCRKNWLNICVCVNYVIFVIWVTMIPIPMEA